MLMPNLGGSTSTASAAEQASAVEAGSVSQLDAVVEPASADVILSTELHQQTFLDPTTLVSVATGGEQANHWSSAPVVSAYADFVAFTSNASNLALGDGYDDDVFVRSLVISETVIISDSTSGEADITPDGRFVAFVSGDNVYVKDLPNGEITLVSVPLGGQGTANGASHNPSISSSGRYIAFESAADNLVSGDTNEYDDIFVYDRSTGEMNLVSVSTEGTQGNMVSAAPAISSSGRYVVFESEANTLVSGDTNDNTDIFVHDLLTGETTRVSVANDGSQADDYSGGADISADGRYIAFVSLASNLVISDTNNVADAFVRDQVLGTTTRVSISSDGIEAGAEIDGAPSISANGRFVVFASEADNLVPDDTNGFEDIFVYDLLLETTTRVSLAANGAEAEDYSSIPVISSDGRYVVFQSAASNLVMNDINGYTDIFVRDRGEGEAPAPNDDLDAAISIETIPFSSTVSTFDATTAADDPAINCGAPDPTEQSHSAWYRFQVGSSQMVRISTYGSNYDTVLAIFTGERGELVQTACADNGLGEQSSIILAAEAGTTYWIEAVQYGDGGGGELRLSVSQAIGGLRGEYFANPTLEAPVSSTNDYQVVDFDWQGRSPLPGELGIDFFSARWTGQMEAEYNETYTLYTLSNDGVRLWLDDQLLIDDWNIHESTWNSATIDLEAGQKYDLRLEYFDDEGDAVIRLEWDSPSTPRQVIPEIRLSYPDLSGSTIEVDPASLAADGVANAAVTVRLADGLGTPISGRPVSIQVSGSQNIVNGIPVGDDEWVSLNRTAPDGSTTATLSSILAETKQIIVQSGQYLVDATVAVTFTNPTIAGLHGEYFNNRFLTPSAELIRYDSTVNFNWGQYTPAPEITSPNFSTRWSGRLEAPASELYTFYLTYDDGIRFWIDGQLLIDDWNINPVQYDESIAYYVPKTATASISLEGGRKYDIRLEYFEYDDPIITRKSARVSLEWESASISKVVIPVEYLSYLDVGGSTVEAAPLSLSANGVMSATIMVSAANSSGMPIVNAPVYIQVSGAGNLIGGEPVTDERSLYIGNTGSDGIVTAGLASTISGSKTVRAYVDGMAVSDSITVTFNPVVANQLLILRAGETATPGSTPGKTGTPEEVFIDEPASFTIQAVDDNWNIDTSFTGTVNITSTDPSATLPVSVTLVNGQALVAATWRTSALQTLSVNLMGVPDMAASESIDVLDQLVVGNGQTITVDDARYAITEMASVGSINLPYDQSVVILPGQEVLIAVLSGANIGTFETAFVETVTANELILCAPLANSYDGTHDKVMVQHIRHFPDVIIQDGGKITAHPWDGHLGGIVAFRAMNLTIETGGEIDVSGLGLSSQDSRYGGHGGYSSSGIAGYGLARTPVTLGGSGDPAIHGGGAIIIEIAGILDLSGSLRANGGTGSSSGAGGSIWVETDQLIGNGDIQANGGESCGSGSYCASGSGGRVALYTAETSYYGTWSAAAGDQATRFGGPGTIYVENTSTGYNELIINNHDQPGKQAILTDPAATIWPFDKITLIHNGDLELHDPQDTLQLDAVVGDRTARIFAHGTIAAPSFTDLVDFGLYIYADGMLSMASDVTVRGQGLTVYGTLDGINNLIISDETGQNSIVRLAATGHSSGQLPGVYRFDTVTVYTAQRLELESNLDTGSGVTLLAENIAVDPLGKITADGLGYNHANPGPGAGTNVESLSGGGGHGGFGGGAGGGQAYGSVLEPVTPGSAGASNDLEVGGAGGGAIKIVVTGTLRLDGLLSANGLEIEGGGGAGGSLWVIAQTIYGTGVINANGGNGFNQYFDGSGAGGRIAVYFNDGSLDVSLEAAGGADGDSGGAGTIYVEHAGVHRLIVDNQDRDGPPAAITDPEATVWAFDQIELLNQGNLELMDSDDSILLTADNMQGDGTGQLYFIQNFEYTLAELQGFGFYVAEGATLTLPAEFTVRGTRLTVYGTLAGASDLTLAAFDDVNSQVRLSAAGQSARQEPAAYVFNSILIEAGQTLELAGNPLNGNGVSLFANEITVAGHLSADEMGFTPENNGAGAATAYEGGGGHGGAGGGTGGGIAYGIPETPTTLGSAGFSTSSGNGGGAMYLAITSTLDIPGGGLVSTNGSSATAFAHGGSAGGSIWITATMVTGAGSIWATGGTGVSAGSGGGGRIAIYADQIDPRLTYNVAGGAGDEPGGRGTLYLEGITIGYGFVATMTPISSTLSMGGAAEYTIHVENIGWLPDILTFTVAGPEASWITVTPETVSLPAGGSEDIVLTITPPGCQDEGTLPFTVTVHSTYSIQGETLAGELSLVDEPQILISSPQAGITSGSRSVLFRWQTLPEALGSLRLYPLGQPDQTQIYTTSITGTHTVLVENLTRDVTYVWQAEATSACGVAASPAYTFTVGSGIVFDERSYDFAIDRDYNQVVTMTVRNEDTISHTLKAIVQNPYPDLVVNFVGSGSSDEIIVLEAGQEASLQLALHAQDAELKSYDLTAVITADEGEAMPIIDTAPVHVSVVFSGDFTVEEIDVNPVTGVRTYRVTNNGSPITDLKIRAIDPTTGLPANIQISPIVNHANLQTGESLTIQTLPAYGEGDLGMGNLSIPYDLDFAGGGSRQTLSSNLQCGGDIYAVTRQNVCMAFQANDWYCTNRPDISVPIFTPAFIKPELVKSADLAMQLRVSRNVLPHNIEIRFNGYLLGSLRVTNAWDWSDYWWSIVPATLRSGQVGMVEQDVNIWTTHLNPGHYAVSTGFELGLGMEAVTVYVCARSQEEAEQIADDTYDFEPLDESGSCPGAPVRDESVQNGCDTSECGAAYPGTQVRDGGPINTRTGGVDYSATDLSFPTSAGTLAFRHWYASTATETYTGTLGYGWTHNLDTRLYLPGHPPAGVQIPEYPEQIEGVLGIRGIVWLKTHSTNLYMFYANLDGSFTPYPGVGGTLYQQSDGYVYTDDGQNVYTFDDQGLLSQWTDAQGHALHYSYTSAGLLERVSDDTGVRYLELHYNPVGQIVMVNDHAERQVSFDYSPATGDLVSAVDVLGQTWTYEYDPAHPHLLATVRDPRGYIVEHNEYDSQGRVVEQTNGEGETVVALDYTDSGNFRAVTGGMTVNSVQTTVADGVGNSETHYYDIRNTLSRQTDGISAGSRSYDWNFRPDALTDAYNHTTSLAWSEDGANLLNVTDAEGNQTSMVYDDLDNLILSTDALGHTTTYAYSGTLLTRITDSLGASAIYTYTSVADWPQPAGLLKAVRDPSGRVTQYGYDRFGQRVAVTDTLGLTTHYFYDELGRLVTVTDPLGRANWMCYNAAGRTIRSVANASGDGLKPQTDPCDAEHYIPTGAVGYDLVTSVIYDIAGNAIATIDIFGRITRTYFDRTNRPVAVVQNLTGWAIDNPYLPPTHLRTATQNLVIQTVYDDAGKVIATIDTTGRITRIYYDAQNRPEYVAQNLTNWGITEDEPPPSNLRTIDQNMITRTIYDKNGNVIATVDAGGRVTRTYYDILNRQEYVTQNLVVRDGLGEPLPVEEAVTRTSPPIYQSSYPNENITSRTIYDANGNAFATVDPAGRINRTYFDTLGRGEYTVQNLTGWEITADEPPTPDLRTVDENLTSQTVYDKAGVAIATIDPAGRVTRTYYDDYGRPYLTVQNLVVLGLDGEPLPNLDAIKKKTPPDYNPAHPDRNLHNETVYDNDDGRAIASIDNSGRVTRTYYDSLGRAYLVVRNLRGQEITDETPPPFNPDFPDRNIRSETIFDGYGRTIASVDAFGRVTRTYFDELGRSWVVVRNLTGQDVQQDTPPAYDPAYPDRNIRTETIYGKGGQAIASVDALGRITRTYTDGLGRAWLTVRNLTGWDVQNETPPSFNPDHPDQNVRSETIYNLAGQAIANVDPIGRVTRTYYDGLGRPWLLVENLTGWAVQNDTPPAYDPTRTDQNLRSETEYDSASQRISAKDANGVVTCFEYDEVGRLTAVVENCIPGTPAGTDANVRTEYTYDVSGNRLAVISSQLPIISEQYSVISYQYDELGRLAAETDALSHIWKYNYDAAGQQASKMDANGFTTYFVYDKLGRLVETDYPDPDADVSFAYNGLGWRTVMTDGVGITRWDYDLVGRPVTITDPFTGTVGYTYNAIGNRTALIYPTGEVITYTFDALNRLTVVGSLSSLIITYTYDAAGQLLTETRANGVTTAYTYDGAGRVTSIEHATAYELLSSFEYAYDAVGNRTAVTETVLQPDTGQVALVRDPYGAPKAGLTVYAFNESSYTGYSGVTDSAGRVSFDLPDGAYRFRADKNGTQFWSGAANHCMVPGCGHVDITVTNPITVTALDTNGNPAAGLAVYAFTGTTYTGKQGVTDANGQVSFTLLQGEYRFRADRNGTQFWSGITDHCTIPGCAGAAITVTIPISVVVLDTGGNPAGGLSVYAFDGETYAGFHEITDASGQAVFTLPQGNYRFRVDKNGTQFWSGSSNHCTLPGCESASVTVTIPVVVTVLDTDGIPQSGLAVYTFDGSTYTNYNKVTDANGQAIFTLPQGNYRFRTDKNGTQFWSDTQNHCTLPGCTATSVTVTIPVVVTVLDTDGNPQAGLSVYAFDSATYTNYNKTTDANGQATFILPTGSYRFRADKNGTQFWSGTSNHCTIPGCTTTSVAVTGALSVTVVDNYGVLQPGLSVYVYDGTTYTGFTGVTNAEGQVSFTLPQGSYRFRADKAGTQFWSGAANHCTIPGCTSAAITVTASVLVTVLDTNGSPAAGLSVYAFNGATYTGYTKTTDANGQASFILPQGSYRFRADKNGVQFWSGSSNHCTIPGCASASVTVTIPVVVTVLDTDGNPAAGLTVYAFNGAAYSGYYKTTDASGQATFTLPQADYRFRADKNGVQFWSGTVNHCTIPGCESASVTVTVPVVVTVLDTDGTPQSGLTVYAFDGTTYTGYYKTTNVSGQATFTLPQGSYRFRADKNGTQFWSDTQNHCTLPGCTAANVTVTIPVIVTILNTNNTPQAGLPVYAFNGSTYTGYNKTTNADGQATFTLPLGNYRFRADKSGGQYWSGSQNHCAIPGCTTAAISVAATGGFDGGSKGIFYSTVPLAETVSAPANWAISTRLAARDPLAALPTLPGWSKLNLPDLTTIRLSDHQTTTTIAYTYDHLYRLKAADYSSGLYFHYTYDSMGNRLTASDPGHTTLYQYDAANRLVSAGHGVTYSWDDNGNLLSDSVNAYSYDHANRLTVVSGQLAVGYGYNGEGDRLRQTVNGTETRYTLDLNTGLIQVLSDGENMYLYGRRRISETGIVGKEYYLSDALGSVRQLADSDGTVTLAKSYNPYGETLDNTGNGATSYGYTGEWTDGTGMVYLRARYYQPGVGRFVQKDPSGIENNLYLYGSANPVVNTDPSGMFSPEEIARSFRKPSFSDLLDYIGTYPTDYIGTHEARHPRHPIWGLIAALLDATPGDRLKFHRININLAVIPQLDQVDEVILDYDPNKNEIVMDKYANISYLLDNIAHTLWRDNSPTHYWLEGQSGLKGLYIDGADRIDLPDFRSVILPDGGRLWWIIQKLLRFESRCGLGFNVSTLVDRWGNIYISGQVGLGFGISLPVYSEGYVTSDAYGAIYRGTNSLIADSNTMISSIQYLSFGGDFFIGVGGVGATSTIWWSRENGSAVVLVSVGGGLSASVDLSYTRYTGDTRPELGWNYLIDALLGLDPSIKATFRGDLEQKAASLTGGMP